MAEESTRTDDEEGDIAGDPRLSEIAAELHSVNKRTDRGLLLALAVAIGLVALYERSPVKSRWLDALWVIAIVGMILLTITAAVRGKRRVAEKYGLVCPACGYRPSVPMILSAATTQRCRKCRAPLGR